MQKHPLDSKRLRRVPAHFSWVDHRLIRHRRLHGIEPSGWALYLFLIAVGDEQGLSYYSDASICEHLGIPVKGLTQARARLRETQLIAWAAPLYQVLDLAWTQSKPAPNRSASSAPQRTHPSPKRDPAMSAEERDAHGQRMAQTFSDLLKGGAQ